MFQGVHTIVNAARKVRAPQGTNRLYIVDNMRNVRCLP